MIFLSTWLTLILPPLLHVPWKAYTMHGAYQSTTCGGIWESFALLLSSDGCGYPSGPCSRCYPVVIPLSFCLHGTLLPSQTHAVPVITSSSHARYVLVTCSRLLPFHQFPILSYTKANPTISSCPRVLLQVSSWLASPTYVKMLLYWLCYIYCSYFCKVP